ncbi:hypothetical protein RC54_01230 [Herbaspirillum rubrisubalbicans]|uniref:Uncharacterized protein n=1 Tax=Herbaspirillum rubrisubalbicans TaxID=80842 RepID=A0AAD0U4A6_9BURK|nr:hypothetical protein RC54_01230 [Herbaspirillum rubrisubalbicans]
MAEISFVVDGRSMAGCTKQIFFIVGRLEQLLLINETFLAFCMARSRWQHRFRNSPVWLQPLCGGRCQTFLKLRRGAC